MRWRQVAVLYVVAAGLGGWYWAVERQVKEAPKTDARPRFLQIDPETLRELRLQRPGEAVLSRREEGGAWVIVEPQGGQVPPDLIAAFANALGSAEEIALVAEHPDDAKQYGLDERASRVEMRPASGDPVVVVLGSTNPTGTAVYARRGVAPEVILIGRNIRYYEDLIFQALTARKAPSTERGAPVGG